MTLGTRGGNLLLRNSRLQTGCECCDPSCSAAWSSATGVSVEITAEDFLLQRTETWNALSLGVATQKISVVGKTSALNGTHVLSKTGTFSTFTRWSTAVSGQPSGCGNITIRLDLVNSPAAHPTNAHYSLSLLNISLLGRLDRQYSSGASGCAEPQYYGVDDLTSCTFSFSDCVQLSAAQGDRDFTARCVSGAFIGLPPYTVNPGQPGFTRGLDWALISSVTDSSNASTAIVVSGIEISLP